MRLGMCTNIESLGLAHAAGYDFAEITIASLLPGEGEAAFAAQREKALAVPIPIEACNCFVPGHLKVVGPEVNMDAVGRHMDLVLRRASELGVTLMVFGSGGARRAPDGFPIDRARAQYCDAAKFAGDIAAKYGVTIVLEPLNRNECNIFNSVELGMRLVQQVNHPHVKLLADSFHMVEIDEPFTQVVEAGEQLAHVHIDMPDVAAVLAGAPSYYPEFIAAVAASGAETRISVENHSFMPEEGKELTAYYAVVREYLGSLQ